ncbi:MAG: hypothetical protein AB7F32_00260 [Victivallaceae bacterium]
MVFFHNSDFVFQLIGEPIAKIILDRSERGCFSALPGRLRGIPEAVCPEIAAGQVGKQTFRAAERTFAIGSKVRRMNTPAGISGRRVAIIGLTRKGGRRAGLVEERRRGRGNSAVADGFFRRRKGKRYIHLPVGKKEFEQAGAKRAQFPAVVPGDRIEGMTGGNEGRAGRLFAAAVTGIMQAVVEDSGQQESRTQYNGASAHQNFLANPVHCLFIPIF